MRKAIIILISLVALALAGCGSASTTTVTHTTVTHAAAPKPPPGITPTALIDCLDGGGARADMNDSRADNTYYLPLLDAPGFKHAVEGWRGGWRGTSEDPNPDDPSVYFWVYDNRTNASNALATFHDSLASDITRAGNVLVTTSDGNIQDNLGLSQSIVTDCLAKAGV